MAGSGQDKKRARDGEDADISPPPVKRKLTSSTNASKVAAFFTPMSQKSPDPVKWREVDEALLVATYKPENTSNATANGRAKRRRIAAFDLDSTLIKTRSGKLFSRDENDWTWWHVCVPDRLRELYNAGMEVIIFSNQGGLNLRLASSKTAKSDRQRTSIFKAKIAALMRDLELPITLYAATEQTSLFRKPRRGMWDAMLDDFDLDEGDGPDMEASYYVGDAAGRDGDFAISDRNFADNIGIAFHTPEEFFLRQKPRPFKRDFDPAALLVGGNEAAAFVKTHDKDIVVLCGSPGAGKSTFYWNVLKPLGYERVNQDILKTRDKCVKHAAEMLNRGTSVAVDNTNADRATRAVWTDLARKSGVPARCVRFTADAQLCEHNDAVRAMGGEMVNPEARTKLPRVAFTGFVSRFEPLSADEGFEDVVVMPFSFAGSDEQRALWTRYWV